MWKIDGAIPHRQRRSPQGNSCFAITTPPAARMAHLRTMARRRFGSSRPTASNSNAATRITINTYRLANMGQWLASYKERSLSGSAVLRKPSTNLIDPYSVAVLGLLSGRRPEALNGTRSGGLVASNCLRAGCSMGSCFTTKGAGRVLRSATRTARKRSWAAIMLRRR